jgi:hypothetical protein
MSAESSPVVIEPAQCVSTSNVSSLSGLQTFDGYTLEAEQTVLLTAQTEAKDNGPWVVGTGAWSRPLDFEAGSVSKARVIAILNGAENGRTQWVLKTNTSVTVGTSPLLWERMVGTSQAQVEALISEKAISPTGKVETNSLLRVNSEGKVEYLPPPSIPGSMLMLNSAGALEWRATRTFDIKTYGAVGDGVTDNHAAIQEAIDKATEDVPTATHVWIILSPAEPGKSYRTSSNFTVPSANQTHVHIRGYGRASRIVLTADLAFGEHLFQTAESEVSAQPDVFYEYVDIEGPKTWPLAPNKKETNGYFPCYAMGFEVANSHTLLYCEASGFYALYDLRGTNHTLWHCRGGSCLYALYHGPDKLSEGTEWGGSNIINFRSPAEWAGVGLFAGSRVEGLNWQEVNIEHAPYVMYKEAPWGVNGQTAYRALTGIEAPSGEECGNAHFFDEGAALYREGSGTPGRELEPLNEGAWSASVRSMNVNFNRDNCVGNMQVLTISASGGTFKVKIPANPTTGLAEATTAALSPTESNSAMETKIKTALNSGSVVVWTNGEGKRAIMLLGYAAMWGTAKMTIVENETTGGTVAISEPAIDPNMGPLVKPSANTAKITIAKATGGTFKLKVTVEGVTQETTALQYNPTAAALQTALNELTNVGVWGSVVADSASPLIVSWVGSLLNKAVTVEPVNELTGTEPTITAGAGPAGKMANRHAEYTFDVNAGKLTITLDGFAPGKSMASASVGIFRTTPSQLLVRGIAGLEMVSAAKSGLKIIGEEKGTIYRYILEMESALYTLAFVTATGAIEQGALLAWSTGNVANGGENKAEIYPATSAKGALAPPPAGFLGAAIAEAGSFWVPVYLASTNGYVSAKYDAVGTPAAKVALKPSSSTAGAITTATEASDLVVGYSAAAGSSGTVKMIPKGMM